jgi:hypothetical protein
VDGGINSATYLGKQPCRDHEGGGKDETTDREVAKHIYLPRHNLEMIPPFSEVGEDLARGGEKQESRWA